jgi:peroxiredoxin
MTKSAKSGVNWLIVICISTLPVLSGCNEEKQNAQPTAGTQTKAVVAEEKTAVQTKPAEIKPKEAAVPAAEVKPKEAAAPTPAAAPQQAVKEPAQPAPAMTVKQLLDEIGFWETAGDEVFGTAVPDFNLMDIDGKAYKLSSYRGKNVLIFEFAIWSAPCKAQIPFLTELRKTMGEDKLAILGVALNTGKEDLQKVKDFVQKQNINFPVFYEPQKSLPQMLTTNLYVPCHYFIGPDGKLKLGVMEIITVRDLIRVIEAQ